MVPLESVHQAFAATLKKLWKKHQHGKSTMPHFSAVLAPQVGQKQDWKNETHGIQLSAELAIDK